MSDILASTWERPQSHPRAFTFDGVIAGSRDSSLFSPTPQEANGIADEGGRVLFSFYDVGNLLAMTPIRNPNDFFACPW